jgi:hypothetical protein
MKDTLVSLTVLIMSYEMMLTFVFTMCNLLGLSFGWSAAPTSATSDVQNSISTIPMAPSSAHTHTGDREQTR